MFKKISKILLIVSFICLLILFLNDSVFFGYVRLFGLKLEYYLLVESLLDFSIPLLAIPAAVSLYYLLRLRMPNFKLLAVLYLLYGLILPFFVFRAFPARFGSLSEEYLSFTSIIINRFYFKLAFVTFLVFYVFPILLCFFDLLKARNKKMLGQFLKTTGIVLGSIILASSIFSVSYLQSLWLIDKLMLANKVTDVLPNFKNVPKQKVLLTDEPSTLINCYLKSKSADLGAKLLGLTIDSTVLIEVGYNAYYSNDACLVVYIGIPLTLEETSNTISAALLSEALIRLHYGDKIRISTAKNPVETIKIIKSADYKTGDPRGVYDSDTNTIEIQQGYDRVFETITHELLHSLSTAHISMYGYSQSGLNEAVTQYLTAEIMHNFSGSGFYTIHIYAEHVQALEELVKYVDKEKLLEVYFNDYFYKLRDDVDKATYKGAFCRFNHYLDISVVEYLETKNYHLSKDYADKAIRALKEDDRQNDSFRCI